MNTVELEQVRLMAAKDLLDRGFDKPYVSGDPDADLVNEANETNVIKVRIINDPELPGEE